MQQLLELITQFEGLRLTAYLCPAGVWTIGYGSTGPDVVEGLVWTPEKAQERMTSVAALMYQKAKQLAPIASESTLCAFADFAYNLGAARLAGSTMLRKYKAGDVAGARLECEKWVWAGARVLPGLILRRNAEAKLIN